jgi:hypothetical protein
MGHLQARSPEAALDVEALVGFRAVKYRLVAPDVGGDVVQGLDDLQAELLPLLVFGHGDVFDVADETQVVNAECFNRY